MNLSGIETATFLLVAQYLKPTAPPRAPSKTNVNQGTPHDVRSTTYCGLFFANSSFKELKIKFTSFQASAAMLMKYALFWDIAQSRVAIPYRRFGTTYRSHLQGSRNPKRKGLLNP
jgi:hypothetical protein